jgi:hypothetical protein
MRSIGRRERRFGVGAVKGADGAGEVVGVGGGGRVRAARRSLENRNLLLVMVPLLPFALPNKSVQP